MVEKDIRELINEAIEKSERFNVEKCPFMWVDKDSNNKNNDNKNILQGTMSI